MEKNGKPTYIYVGAENKGQYYPEFSTKIVNQIHDKSGLDSEIVSNTAQLGNYNLVGNVNKYGKLADHTRLLLENSDNDMIIETTKVTNISNNIPININRVYIGGKLYYITKLPTLSGNYIGVASESTKGPFNTTLFNKMAKEFCKNVGNMMQIIK